MPILCRVVVRLSSTPLWIVAAALAATVGTAPAAAQQCDRACLTGMVTRYLNALVAHDPQSLPLAPNVRFTEDAMELRVGEGAWKTVTRLRPYRVDFIDVQEGVAAVHAVVEENGMPVLLAARGDGGARVTLSGWPAHAAEAFFESVPLGASSGWD